MVPRRRPQQQENAQCIDARAVFYPRHHRMTMQLRIDNGRLDQLASSALRKDKRETSGRRLRLTGSVCPVPYYGCGPFLWASFPGRCGGRVRLFPSTVRFLQSAHATHHDDSWADCGHGVGIRGRVGLYLQSAENRLLRGSELAEPVYFRRVLQASRPMRRGEKGADDILFSAG